MRKNYEMTQEQLDKLLKACEQVPLVAVHCGPAPSQQELANIAWEALGNEMGFDFMTVRPIRGEDNKHFSAEEKVQ
jgi:hypothetical protein